MKRIIFTEGPYRIVECLDDCFSIDDLMGDVFCPIANPDLDKEKLAIEKKQFIKKVENEGVFGYVLEKWNSGVGMGWEDMSSCWGFVGPYDEKNNDHYIVQELKLEIEQDSKSQIEKGK